jgi:hypothetical protein
MAYPYLRQAQDCLAKQLLARVVGQQQLLHLVGHHLQGQLHQQQIMTGKQNEKTVFDSPKEKLRARFKKCNIS